MPDAPDRQRLSRVIATHLHNPERIEDQAFTLWLTALDVHYLLDKPPLLCFAIGHEWCSGKKQVGLQSRPSNLPPIHSPIRSSAIAPASQSQSNQSHPVTPRPIGPIRPICPIPSRVIVIAGQSSAQSHPVKAIESVRKCDHPTAPPISLFTIHYSQFTPIPT
jgi:hypothetical protein